MIDTSRTPEQMAQTDDVIEQARQARSKVLLLLDQLELFADALSKPKPHHRRAEGERRS